MNNNGKSRASLVMAIEMLYLLPIVMISGFSLKLMPLNSSWKLFSIGLLLSVCGSCLLFFLIKNWETTLREQLESHAKQLRPIIPKVEKDPEDIQQKIKEAEAVLNQEIEKLTTQLALKDEELHQAFEEKKNLQDQILSIRQELENYQTIMRNQVATEKEQNIENQRVISNQQRQIENQLEKISQLETKVHDLSYEIKTLVCLSKED